MTRLTQLALVLVASLALAAGAAFGSSAMKTKTLKGTVGPGYTISLKFHGKKVKKLKRGKYTFVISDKASIHSFTLEKEKGKPKFEKDLTTVAFVGKKTRTIRLTKGLWKYYCTPHESLMHGFFTVK